MKAGKLFQLHRTLNALELQQFRDFLHSPFHNKREDCRQLGEILEELREGQFPEKEDIFRKIFPSAPYDDQRFRLLQSALLGLLESFLAIQAGRQNRMAQEVMVIEEYRKRGLEKHMKGAWRRAQKLLGEGPQTADALHARHQMELEAFQLEAQKNRIGNLSYQPLIDQWDEYYLAVKLRQACSAKAHEAVANTTYDYGLLDALLDRVDWQRYMYLPAISLYYYGYWMQVRPEEETYFSAFKKELILHNESFPLSERKDLFLLAANYCARKYNEGRSDYAHESNEIYKAGLASGAFLVRGQLSRFTFRNIVVNALLVGDFEWVETFIEEYQNYLAPHYRESTVSFNRAQLEYRRQNYGRALELLQKSEYRDLLLNLSAKALLIKVFYEMGEYDLLEAHLAAMRTFIRRQKNLGYHEVNFRQLVQFAQRLLELNPYDTGARIRLKEEVTATKAVAEKDWLLRMLEDKN
jgi:hypothetical protein